MRADGECKMWVVASCLVSSVLARQRIAPLSSFPSLTRVAFFCIAIREYYTAHHVQCWEKMVVPCFVTSNSFIARAYAR